MWASIAAFDLCRKNIENFRLKLIFHFYLGNYMYFYPPKLGPKTMIKEQEIADTLTEELVENEKSLLLINDDVNTFEYVIETLMKVCHHTREQAETCAWITHYKGKCAVMHGSFEELKPYYDILLGHQLTVKITD
jgi:ATP-dependent Clp protease adaptor protein ClpS